MGIIFCDCALIFLCHLPYLPGGFLAVSWRFPGGFLAVSGECLEKRGFAFLGGSLAVLWRFPGGFLALEMGTSLLGVMPRIFIFVHSRTSVRCQNL